MQLTCVQYRIQVVRRAYGGWKCDTPNGIGDAKFKTTAEEVHLQIQRNWHNIGNGWKLRPGSTPLVNSCMYNYCSHVSYPWSASGSLA